MHRKCDKSRGSVLARGGLERIALTMKAHLSEEGNMVIFTQMQGDRLTHALFVAVLWYHNIHTYPMYMYI